MRVVRTITDEKEARGFSFYLNDKGIENQCEEVKLHRKDPIYRIWVIDEDKIDLAHQLYDQYLQNPVAAPQAEVVEEERLENIERPKLSPSPYGILSKIIIVLCVLIFLWSAFNKGIQGPPKIPGIVMGPIMSGVMKTLVFDYPAYFEKRDHLLSLYTPEMIKNGEEPSPEAARLIQEIKETPFWNGFYDRVVDRIQNKDRPISYSGPMFEKISKGQIWRIFTPVLLHYDLLHIFFNLLWFILLGNQIEYKIGSLRYAALIFLGAIIPNTAQYLMSGSFFMGLSGVVVALAGFVWARQQVAPWEGYLLQRSTLLFLGFFVIGIFALQVVFFFLQIFGKMELNIQIANTAHIVGGLVGYLLGRMKGFAIKKN